MPRPAYVVDVDEDSGKRVKGSRRSAKTNAKEKPKVSQRDSGRSDKSTRRDTADVDYAGARAVASPGARKVEAVTTVKQERRKSSSSSSTHSPRKENRPPSSHKNRALAKLQIPFHHSKKEDPTHFGIPTPTRHAPAPIVSQPKLITQPIPMRPRPTQAQTYPRPQSFHAAYTSSGGYGPPLSSSAFYQPPPTPFTPSYPPPSPSYMQQVRYSIAPAPAPPQTDYFGSYAMSAPERPVSARPLHSRFDPPSRTSSAFGSRPVSQDINDAYAAGYYDDAYTSASEGVASRRESIRVPSRSSHRLSKTEADMLAMPPPPVPRPILRRPPTEYSADSSDGYEGRTLIRNDSRSRRPSINRNSVSYDIGGPHERIETANNGRRRSYYGQSASTGSGGYEEKIRQASAYQVDVGETAPLTAEGLKKHQRRQAGSSRSTKSSASRDESDWRKSATTRTTRSGSGGDSENVTIKINGTARVSVGGAQIDCPDGGEIEIRNGQKAIRNGSERSSEYGGPPRIDDRRSRDERTTSGRTRISSRHSYTRQRPQQYYGESRDGGWI